MRSHTPETLIARLGRWCFRHRFTVLALWVAAVAGGVLAAGPVFDSMSGDNGPSEIEAIAGDNVLDEASTGGGSVVGVVDGVDPDDPAVRAAVRATAADLAGGPGITAVVTPYTDGLPPAQAARLVARDHHGLVIRAQLADLTGDAYDAAAEAARTRLHALAAALPATAGAPTVEVGGANFVNEQANQQVQQDLSAAEVLSLPITLVILVIVFGGLIAAGVPVLGAIVSIAGAFGVLLLFTKLTNLNQNAVTVVTLLGLGLSVDYGLLLVARYRDELAGGYEPADAIARAWATAGRTILFSALTVAAALSGMLVFGITGLSALGAAGVSITLVSLLVGLTFTAALLGLSGRWVRPSRRAAARALRRERSDGYGFFAGLARIVQRRPVTIAVATAVALLAAGWPLLSMTIRVDEFDSVPRSLEAVRVVDVLTDKYGLPHSPAVIVVARTDAASLDAWATRLAGSTDVATLHPAVTVAPGLARLDLDPVGEPEGAAALRLVDRIRGDRPPGQSWVTGIAAIHTDFIGRIVDRLPYAIGLTIGAMILLLFAMTGSLVAPIKAVVMNVVSLGASFGVLDAVFEHGVLSGLLHTTTVSGITPFVLVTVFAFAFGLSMDYEVFLLARIKEQVDLGVPNDAAVRRGLQRSGRIITSAALLLVIVFGCFLVARMGTVQQIGLGLAVAVAVDATIVRCVLVPATMTLLGRWNWWAPAPLRRLHRRLGLDRHLGESEPAVAEPVGARA